MKILIFLLNRVLLDHGVPEENIIFVTVISAPSGLHLLSYSFPKVKIVTWYDSFTKTKLEKKKKKEKNF